MSNIKNAIIAAAGLGRRLGFDMPKPLVKILDKPLIEHQLRLLQHIENIYIIVGFQAEELIHFVTQLRKDAIFVVNHSYATTNTLFSLQLALRYVKGPYIFLDGDIYFNPHDFHKFITTANHSQEPIIGITRSKSEEGVFAKLNSKKEVVGFTREEEQPYEWLGTGYFNSIPFKSQDNNGFVFSELQQYLPLPSFLFDAYEIDTPKDLELAQKSLTTAS